MIKVKDINYKIGDIEILKNVNFEIQEEEIVVLVGANGSGKSTIVKSMGSLVKYKGEIEVFNHVLGNLNSKTRSRMISYLPQNCIKTNIKVKTLIKHSRFPYMRFGEKLTSVDEEIINNAIDFTGVRHILNKNVMDISGGERQLAYLTMVIAQDTPIMLLDEPNTFLDLEHQIFLFDLIKKLKNKGKSIVIVLHDMIQALEIADKIIVINNGQVVSCGKPQNVIGDIEKLFNVKIAKLKDITEEETPLFEYCLLKDDKDVSEK